MAIKEKPAVYRFEVPAGRGNDGLSPNHNAITPGPGSVLIDEYGVPGYVHRTVPPSKGAHNVSEYTPAPYSRQTPPMSAATANPSEDTSQRPQVTLGKDA